MSGNKKRPLVPLSRFPEFQDAPEWSAEKLEALITTVSPPSKLQSSSYLKKGKYPIIDQSQDFICGWTDDDGAVIDNSLPLIIFGDHTCALKFVNEPFAQGADGIKILKAKSAISAEYLFHSLNHNPLMMEDYKRHFSMLRERVVAFPNIKSGEQQKIADCLSSLDELIVAETQKLRALKTHKIGLMQQLFPREGEAVPQRRFPEFVGTAEWKEWSIGELGEVITGNTPSTSKPQYYGGEFNFVSPADISDHRFVEKTKTSLTKLGFEQTRKIAEGSVLFVCIGSTIGKVAQNRFRCATNQQINSLVPFAEFSGDFIYYLLLRESARIAELAGNQAVPIINKTTFSEFIVRCPQKGEQDRIAESLGALDKSISIQAKKIDTLKTHKDGLMQKLFPVFDEVSS
ncbi:restriction endonuclease subunit S [Pseudomonas citronellolis]|uniref:restriction endonuclease subunit S n=1 Tax=Pseudomonas citronellolis TaxID=53408 RepID=UPI0018D83BAF|nr:restriction endonuclease subunit S [Pseudomonas citronellolis]MBH3431287.1 restriction endonuclease subunit S [Pseudomonas citronellolis]